MQQFADVCVYRCLACGRVLLTQGGAERHKQRCKYITPIMKGQISMDEWVDRERPRVEEGGITCAYKTRKMGN